MRRWGPPRPFAMWVMPTSHGVGWARPETNPLAYRRTRASAKDTNTQTKLARELRSNDYASCSVTKKNSWTRDTLKYLLPNNALYNCGVANAANTT